MTDICFLSAAEASARIADGSLTCEALARACLDRIAGRDETVRAWTWLDPDRIIAKARELDRSPWRGPLHGIPIGVKDMILTKDMPTGYNSPVYHGSHVAMDAACVATLRAAGALIFGKTDTVEFAAMGRRAATRNPHDPTRTPGGSSSGSAAAVADFHVPISLGTQTGGSTLRPSSFCGVYAMKPTWNAVSREGLKMYSATLDTLGWYGRSVADLALLADVFAIEDDVPPPSKSIADLRIALCRTPMWGQAEPAAQQTLLLAAQSLIRAGATVIDLDLPESFDGLSEDQNVIMRSEGRAAFLSEVRQFGDRLHEDFRNQVANRDGFSRRMQLDAYARADAARLAFDELAAPFDAVLTPSAVGEATVGLASTGNAIFQRMWTLLHVPCIGMPFGTGPAGMPIGLTLTAPRFRDRQLLGAAALIADAIALPAGVAIPAAA